MIFPIFVLINLWVEALVNIGSSFTSNLWLTLQSILKLHLILSLLRKQSGYGRLSSQTYVFVLFLATNSSELGEKGAVSLLFKIVSNASKKNALMTKTVLETLVLLLKSSKSEVISC